MQEWFSANEQIFSEEKRLYDRLGDLWGKGLEAFSAAVDYAQMHVRLSRIFEWKRRRHKRKADEYLAGYGKGCEGALLGESVDAR